jgi:hypothetical protein
MPTGTIRINRATAATLFKTLNVSLRQRRLIDETDRVGSLSVVVTAPGSSFSAHS